MSFYSKEEIQNLLSDFQILKLDEIEYDGKTKGNQNKHWDIVYFIVRAY